MLAQTQQPYEYADGNPLNETDLLGLDSCWYCIVDPWSHANPLYQNAEHGGTASRVIQQWDPAYMAISGYANEWQAAESGCSAGTIASFGAQAVLGVFGTIDPETDFAAPADGAVMSTADALDAGEAWLGPGYTEPVAGSGRFVSADGQRVFRMGGSDVAGTHGGGPHVNFETLGSNPARPGRMMVTRNIHVFLND